MLTGCAAKTWYNPNKLVQERDTDLLECEKVVEDSQGITFRKFGVFETKESDMLASCMQTKHYELGNNTENSKREMLASDYMVEGKEYYNKQKYDDAIAAYGKALVYMKTNPFIYTAIGDTYIKQKKYDLAVSNYSSAIEYNPSHAYHYVQRAQTYVEINDTDKAIDDCNKGISIDINDAFSNALLLYVRGTAYLRRMEYSHALEDLNKAIELKPDLWIAYSARGHTYLITGNKAMAKKDFSIACEKGYKDECNHLKA